MTRIPLSWTFHRSESGNRAPKIQPWGHVQGQMHKLGDKHGPKGAASRANLREACDVSRSERL